ELHVVGTRHVIGVRGSCDRQEGCTQEHARRCEVAHVTRETAEPAPRFRAPILPDGRPSWGIASAWRSPKTGKMPRRHHAARPVAPRRSGASTTPQGAFAVNGGSR